MGFLDKFGEKVSSTSKEVSKKAKDLANIASLNSKITTEEDSIKKAYTKIGQLFYETNKDFEVDEVFTEYFTAIKASEESISELKSEINKIKGVVICKECGAEIANDVAFCSKCGAKVEQVKEEEPVTEEKAGIITCTNCGAELAEGVAFCTKCGTKVENPTDEAVEEAAVSEDTKEVSDETV